MTRPWVPPCAHACMHIKLPPCSRAAALSVRAPAADATAELCSPCAALLPYRARKLRRAVDAVQPLLEEARAEVSYLEDVEVGGRRRCGLRSKEGADCYVPRGGWRIVPCFADNERLWVRS